MNKHGMRWISLILSVAVMIGSLTYIATGFNAETIGQTSYIASDTSSKSSGVLIDADDIITTDDDLMQETAQDTWVYETVLSDGGYLVSENADIYLDLVPYSDTSVSVGDKVELAVTMENTTANDYHTDSATNDEVSDAVDVKSISFSLAFDGTYLKFVSGESNIEGTEFTATGTGAGSAVQISYTSGENKPELKAHEMPVFMLDFEAVRESASADAVTLVSIEDSAAVISPTTLTIAAGEAEDYKIYRANGNNALAGLEVSLENGDEANIPVILNPEFDSEINDYYITVPYNTIKSDIVINADPADIKAAESYVWESAGELTAGINRCAVNVKAADGSTQTYNLIVRKLALDTLADPQTTVKKTVKITSRGTSDSKDTYKVNYEISGVNDILAGGNDYVVYTTSAQTNKLDVEAIRANTANLAESTLTVIDTSLAKPQIITYNLASPALESKSEYVTGTIDPAEYILSGRFTNDNKYLILTDSSATETAVTEKTGYTEIVLPDDVNMTQNLTAAGIDNTAAEFVFIVDFSNTVAGTGSSAATVNQTLNNGLVKALFGYDDGIESTSDLNGYIDQIRDTLSNDSTAKVTVIAVGANIGAGSTAEEWEQYGVKFVTVPDSGDAVFTEDYSYDLLNSVYRGQTYVIPQAVNEIWGFDGGNSEQHNIWEYCNSFTSRTLTGSTTPYTSAVAASSELLTAQYTAAVNEAKTILAGANNAHLVILTPNEALARTNTSTLTGIETTIVPVNGYAAQSSELVVAQSIQDNLVIDAKEAYICDPGSNDSTLSVVEELNRKVYHQIKEPKANTDIVGAGTCFDPVIVEDMFVFDTTWYLPAIGEYTLTAEYEAIRWSDSNVDTETHYYPLTNTVKSDVSEDDTVIKDDIPTVAPSYDDEYELTVTKAITKFDDKGAVKPEESTITYVLLYTNTGKNTLTSVGVTDSQIMLAGNNVKIYILKDGKLAPDSNDYPLGVNFTAAGGNKGELTINSLDPGETIYVEYTITVPESAKVTVGTTRAASAESDKVITSYLIKNTATGAANEVNVVEVGLDIEFEYDKDSGGTVSTSTSSTTASTTTSNLPTVTTYNSTTTTTTKIIYKDDVPTGESSVGYIVAMSLLFGALGVFGVTIYGIVLDRKIERAASASGSNRIKLN